MSRQENAIPGSEQQGWLRPQSVVFTLLAEHLLGHDLAMFSGGFGYFSRACYGLVL
jgi:hypothetical protein